MVCLFSRVPTEVVLTGGTDDVATSCDPRILAEYTQAYTDDLVRELLRIMKIWKSRRQKDIGPARWNEENKLVSQLDRYLKNWETIGWKENRARMERKQERIRRKKEEDMEQYKIHNIKMGTGVVVDGNYYSRTELAKANGMKELAHASKG